MRLGFRSLGGSGLLLSCLLHALPATAQDAKELGRARALFQQATELEQAGNWSAAVQRFREVGQVRMTPQVRFHIALCEDKLGRLVAALGGYELALADANSVGPDFRAEVEGNVTRLRERIPKLVIQRGAGAQAAVIELDGVSVGDSSVGVDVPQDPGPHAITARAPNFQPFESTVTLAEGERKVIEIVMEPAPEEGPPARRAELPPPPPPRKVNLVPYIVGGAGAATLLASGVFFALRQSTKSGLDDRCNGTTCPTSERGSVSRLKTYHYASLVTLGVGVAALGTGAALYVLDLKKQKQEQHTALTVLPSVAPDYAGLAAFAAF
ncbi:MAG TPA: hypothetical protein VG937_19080 [Polyangiaceae bacterium]|nr:hypothetical protein [Polyangiaceae bacterium]